MNIILIVFDSLRKDCVGAFGSPFWGRVHTPHFDSFARESILFTGMYPESLPTLPTRRALYTGRRVYPFHNGNFLLKGDFVGAPGWGPIPEEHDTLAELLQAAGYRTALISDVYHQFKPSKNFWRGFDQWTFLRGQEKDFARSGPRLTQEELDYWLPREHQKPNTLSFIQQCILNMRDRSREEDYFAPRVMKEAALWLEQNQDADRFFLTVESFDPHEPWLVPAHYRKMYLTEEGQEQVKSGYREGGISAELLRRTQANYSGCVTLCDRWFGHFMESMRVLGLLDNTMIIFTTDHGHSIGDRNYIGKRGYPSMPEVYDVPLMTRMPGGRNSGIKSNMLLQHTDIAAQILESAEVDQPDGLDGRPFISEALIGGTGRRDHVTIGWGSAVTVIKDNWWFNGKVDGKGVLLYDTKAIGDPFANNVASEHPDVAESMFETARNDAGGSFPEWLVDLARNHADAPGCSDLAARK